MFSATVPSSLVRPPDPATLDQAAAAAFVGISAKGLERLAAAGEPVGRIKLGRRVVYLRTALERWLEAKTAPSA